MVLTTVEHSLITLNFVFFLRSFSDMYLSLYYKWELMIHEELSMDAPKSSDFPPTLLSTQFILSLCGMFLFQRMHWCFLVDYLYYSMINPSSGSSLGVFTEHFDNISYFCPQTSRYRSLWGILGALCQISCSEFGFFLIVVSLVHEFLKGSIYIFLPACFFSHCELPIVFQCTTFVPHLFPHTGTHSCITSLFFLFLEPHTI